MWHSYHTADSIDHALEVLAAQGSRARVVAGGTDLILEMEKGLRNGVDVLVDITRIPGLDRIEVDSNGWVHLGPLVTHNHCAGSKILRDRAFALARACWEVGAPQIRNRGTVAGNLITASPANDSISPLMAFDAQVTLRSLESERTVPLRDFYTGVRCTVMRDDEMLTDIAFPLPPEGSRSTFIKLALRRAQAISVINVAVLLVMEKGEVQSAVITLGSVAPTIVHAKQAQDYLVGKHLTSDVMQQASRLAAQAAKPIDDLRSSAAYRKEMVRVCTHRALRRLVAGDERQGFPVDPIMLWGPQEWHWRDPLDGPLQHGPQDVIQTTINGEPYTFTSGQDKTLLRLLREEAGLMGTKEGCAEGECGACTVYLDGMAVMSCLVPAPRAHGAEIITIEGLGTEGALHPMQHAFMEEGAVQCGYCTPGFIMTGAKLLEERPHPDRNEIRQAITGNLCRCTGYYKIVSAFERAAEALDG